MTDHHLDHLLDLGVLFCSWLGGDYTNVVITLIAAYLWKFLLMCPLVFALITHHSRRLVCQSHHTPPTILQRFRRSILFRALIVVLLSATAIVIRLMAVLAMAIPCRRRFIFGPVFAILFVCSG